MCSKEELTKLILIKTYKKQGKDYRGLMKTNVEDIEETDTSSCVYIKMKLCQQVQE